MLDKAVVFLLYSAAIVTSPGWSQETHKFTARELFYGDPAPPPSKPTDPPAKAPKITHQTNKAIPKKPHRNQVVEPAEIGERHESEGSANAVLVKASSTSMMSVPLAIRVSVLKIENGRTIEMDPDAELRKDDHIRLNVEVNETGYLYVLNRGSSGTWMPMFPSSKTAELSNLVQRGVKYEIPSGYGFTITDPPGAERLFVIFSRKPELDMESLTDDMSRRDKSLAPAVEKTTPKTPKFPQTYALNVAPLNDATVDRLRNTYSRDLIIEKVNEETPGPQKEKAVYAAVASGGMDARVVLDVQIKHP